MISRSFCFLIVFLMMPSAVFAYSTYVVQDIIQNGGGYNGSLCVSHQTTDGQTEGPDESCNQVVLMFVSPAKDQVAFLQQTEDGYHTFILFHGALLKRNAHCDSFLASADLPKLFESDICRAFRSEKMNSESEDGYFFFPNMAPGAAQDYDLLAEAISRAIVTGSLTGLPIGFASADRVLIPKNNPDQVTIQELTVDVVFFVKSTTTRSYVLVKR